MLRSKTSSCMRVACIRCAGRIEKGNQQRVLRLCQRHGDVVWIGKTAQTPVELPTTAKSAAPLGGVSTRSRHAGLTAPQHRADARKQFAEPKRLCKVIVR